MKGRIKSRITIRIKNPRSPAGLNLIAVAAPAGVSESIALSLGRPATQQVWGNQRYGLRGAFA